MDFLTKLPTTKYKNTAVLVVVDKLTKMVHFIALKDTANAEDVANLFVREIFRLHGLLKVIISDRDPKFTSIFWQALFKKLGTRFNMSSARHSQTDGQSERAIQ